MPEISRFYGIIIRMHYREHPPPHFHDYSTQRIQVEISTGRVRGDMYRRALRLIWEWLDQHAEELLQNWQLAQQRKPLNKIPALE